MVRRRSGGQEAAVWSAVVGALLGVVRAVSFVGRPSRRDVFVELGRHLLMATVVFAGSFEFVRVCND